MGDDADVAELRAQLAKKDALLEKLRGRRTSSSSAAQLHQLQDELARAPRSRACGAGAAAVLAGG